MQQLSRNERQKLRQQEKEAARQLEARQKKSTNITIILAVLVPLLLIGGLFWYAFNNAPSVQEIPDVGNPIPLQGQEHIAEGSEHPLYNSNPPTSGWHYDTPADWGVYQEELPQERLIHNLEHGGIVIQYKPELDKAIVTKLEDLKKAEFECKLVVAPYKGLDKNIALTAWGRLYKTDEYNETDIKSFIKKYRETGPEFVPCTVPSSQMQR